MASQAGKDKAERETTNFSSIVLLTKHSSNIWQEKDLTQPATFSGESHSELIEFVKGYVKELFYPALKGFHVSLTFFSLVFQIVHRKVAGDYPYSMKYSSYWVKKFLVGEVDEDDQTYFYIFGAKNKKIVRKIEIVVQGQGILKYLTYIIYTGDKNYPRVFKRQRTFTSSCLLFMDHPVSQVAALDYQLQSTSAVVRENQMSSTSPFCRGAIVTLEDRDPVVIPADTNVNEPEENTENRSLGGEMSATALEIPPETSTCTEGLPSLHPNALIVLEDAQVIISAFVAGIRNWSRTFNENVGTTALKPETKDVATQTNREILEATKDMAIFANYDFERMSDVNLINPANMPIKIATVAFDSFENITDDNFITIDTDSDMDVEDNANESLNPKNIQININANEEEDDDVIICEPPGDPEDEIGQGD